MTVASNTSVRNKVDVRDVIYIRGMVFYAALLFPNVWLEYGIKHAGVKKLAFSISFSVRKW